MSDRAATAVARAREVLAVLEHELVAKTIWGSPAGKKKLAARLVALLPPHTKYVEPFAGSAAVFFAKEPAEVEALNDADPEIAEAYRLIKALTPQKLERLRKMEWTGNETAFKRLFDAKPTGELERLHRFLYLTHFSYGKLRGRSFNPNAAGVPARTVDRIESFAPRLKAVRIYSGDYEKVVRKYDSKNTTFYLDPPYAGHNVDVGEGDFDEERFFGVLKSIKGKFLLTYGVRGKLPGLLKGSGFTVKRIRTPRSIRSMRGVEGPKMLTQLLVTNYAQKADVPWLEDVGDAEKAAWSTAYVNDLPDSAFLFVERGGRTDDDGKTVPRSLRHFPVRDADGELDLPHLRNAIARLPQAKIPGLSAADLEALQEKARRLLEEAQRAEKTEKGEAFAKAIPLIKGADPGDERYVLGVVLEPEVVDAQGDIYSADEVRQAAHRFMEEFGGLGLMHRFRVNDQVKVLESYLAPTDVTLGEVRVRKGTWLLAVRVLADELWAQVKDGQLTGFSIGGSARRQSEARPADASEENPPAPAEKLELSTESASSPPALEAAAASSEHDAVCPIEEAAAVSVEHDSAPPTEEAAS